MGKTFRRDKPFRPKAHGRSFNKDHQPWKKSKKQPKEDAQLLSEDITQTNT
jgi:hypothetical protein